MWPRPSVLKDETEATGAAGYLMPQAPAGQIKQQRTPAGGSNVRWAVGAPACSGLDAVIIL